MVASCKIVVLAMLDQLVASQHAVFCKIHVSGLGINKGTGDCGNQLAVIRKLIATNIGAVCCNSTLTDQRITFVVEIVHLTINFEPLILVISQRVIVTSALNTIHNEGVPATQNLTLLAFHLVNAIACKGERTNGCIAGSVIKVMGIAVDYHKALLLEVSLIISPANTVMIEAGERIAGQIHAILIKGMHNTIDQILAGNLNTIHVVISVLIPTIGNHNAVHIELAVSMGTVEQLTAIHASQLALCIDSIFMAQCRNNSAPIKHSTATGSGVTLMTQLFLSYAVTANTEHSADVTGFCAGCILIGCCAGYMEMPAALAFKVNLIACRTTPPCTDLLLGVHLDFVAGKPLSTAIDKLCVARQRIDDNVCIEGYPLLPALIGVVHAIAIQIVVTACRRKITGIILFFPLPSLYGNRSKNLLACSLYIAGTLDGQIQNVFVCLVKCIGGSKTVKSFDMIGQPGVNIVEVKGQSNLINLFHVCCNNVDPVLRTGKDHACMNLGHYLNSSVFTRTLNLDLSDDGSIVARFITSSKLDGVHTIGKLGCCNRDHAAIEGALYFVTVDVCLNAGSIQTGGINQLHIFSNGNTECNLVILGNAGLLALIIQIFVFTANRLYIGNFTKGRSFLIVASLRVVNDNIVNIERIDALMAGNGYPVIFAAATTIQLTGQLNAEAGITVIVIHIFEFRSLFQDDRIVLTDIHCAVMPTGFFEVQGVTKVDRIFINGDLLSVFNAGKAESDCSTYSILGEIDPGTDGFDVIVLHSFVCPVDTGASPVQGCISIVAVNRTCTIAVMNHSVFGSNRIIINNNIVECGSCRLSPVLSLLNLLYVPIRTKAILEIIEHLRSLAEHNIHRCSYRRIVGKRCYNGTTGYGGIRSCSQFIAVQSAHIGRTKFHLEIGILGNDFEQSILCRNRESGALAVGNSQSRLTEDDFIGNHNIDCTFTDHFALIYHLCTYCTGFAIGDKQTVLVNRTEGFIGQLPYCTCRNFCCITYKVSTLRSELNFAAGGKILTLRFNACACKSTVRGSGGNKANTGGRGTEAAIGRRVVYLQVFTGTLRNKGRRTATVTVCSPNTTGSNHNLCALVHIHTGGEGRLTAVIFHHNNLAICGNTDHRARCGIVFVGSFLLIHTVFDNVTAGNRNNRIFPTIKVGRGADLHHFQFGHVSRSRIAVCVNILIDNNASGETDVAVIITAITGIKHDLAVHHHEAERFAYAVCIITGIPGQTAVHRTDYFTFHVLVDPECLVKHGTGLVLGCIHFRIRRNYTYIGIAYVSFHNMNNLTIVTCIVIQNDFGLRNAGRIVPVSLRDEVVVPIRACRSIVLIIDTCSKHRKRNRGHNAQHHYTSQHKCNTSVHDSLHSFSSFFRFPYLFFRSESYGYSDSNI